MKKRTVVIVFFIAIGIAMVGYLFLKSSISINKKQEIRSNQQEAKKLQDMDSTNSLQASGELQERTSVFVPYWQFSENSDLEIGNYDRVIYFGITGGTNGIDRLDPGFQNLEAFSHLRGVKEAYLTVRMTNSDVNSGVLEDGDAQEMIVKDTIEIAKEHKFKGIVFDFEYNTLFGGDTPEAISAFVRRFASASHEANLRFATAIYGDVFYRKRPYDVQTIASISDEIMIMAYDFHKSRGEPGPNFPLKGTHKYGYDYDQMMKDFLRFTPPEKLTVIFGMYGYDWIVDEKKRPIKPATAMTLAQISEDYIDQCEILNCVSFRDALSAETEIDFVDQYHRYHVIWFEDEVSVKRKLEFLEKKGVSSTVFWAYGYF